MTRQEKHLENLDDYVSTIPRRDRTKIIKAYQEEIEERLSKGEKIMSILENLGEEELLAKKILRSYESSFSRLKPTFLTQVSQTTVNFFKDFIHLLNTKENERVFLLILRLIFIFFIVFLLALPFKIVELIGHFFLTNYPGLLPNFLDVLWVGCSKLAYYILSIIFLYRSLEDFQTELNGVAYKKMKLPKIGGEELLLKQTNTFHIIEPILTVLKGMMIIMSIPILLVFCGLAFGMGALVGLLVEGIPVIGILMMAFGLLFLVGCLLVYLYRFVFQKDGGHK